MDPIMGSLAYFDDEADEYVCNTNYRPVAYTPYPFIASRISPFVPMSELAPSTPGLEPRKAASFLDLDSNLRSWTQACMVPSLRKDDGQKTEGFELALSAAYAPADWLSEEDWFDGADVSTDNFDMTDSFRSEPAPPNDQARKTEHKKTSEEHKGDRSACPDAESGSLVEGDHSACPGAELATLAEGSCSVRPGTELAPLEERYEEQENYKGDRGAPRGAESGSLVEGCRSIRLGVKSAALAEGSCSGCPGPQSAPLEERTNKGGRSTSSDAKSAALAKGSCSGCPGPQSASFEERLQEQEFYEGGCSARQSAKSVSFAEVGCNASTGAESAYLAEGSCSEPSGSESAPLEERVVKGGRSGPSGTESVYLAEGGCSELSGVQSAYLEERTKVAERLEDVGVMEAMARMDVMRTGSSISVETRSILKRSRTEELQPEPSAKRVRWCHPTDALPTPTNTRDGKSQRLYSPRPPQRWDQRLAHGVAKIKAAFSVAVVKSQSPHAM